MKNILVITLGNRDLQFYNQLPDSFKLYTVSNNDDKQKLIINTRHDSTSFCDISAMFWENFECLKEYFQFPMIEKTIHAVISEKHDNNETELFFVTSDQTPRDKQDCCYIALICKKFFETQFKVHVKNFSCTPTNFYELTQFFSNLFNEIISNSQHAKLVVSNSGGTPDMRAASYTAGFFKGIEYLTIEARTKQVNKSTFTQLENKVLHNIIFKMLAAYDYQGILNLPVSSEIKNIAQKALDHYNLNIDSGFIQKKNQPGEPYNEKAIFGIKLLIENKRICYLQGRYAEALQRLFRIEEATWYLLYYLFLKSNNLLSEKNYNKIILNDVNGQSKSYDIEKVLDFGKPYNVQLIKQKINAPNLEVIEKDGKYFLKVDNKETPLYGKNFYYNFLSYFKFHTKFVDFFAQLNLDSENQFYTNKSKLNSLRNKSFLGHGLNGITKEELDSLYPEKSFELFDSTYRTLFTELTGSECPKIFEIFNEEIKGKL